LIAVHGTQQYICKIQRKEVKVYLIIFTGKR